MKKLSGPQPGEYRVIKIGNGQTIIKRVIDGYIRKYPIESKELKVGELVTVQVGYSQEV